MKSITLFAVENYAQPLEKGKMEVSYDEAIKLLENDQDKVSYHIRVYNNTSTYPLFCDIDGTKEQMAKPLDEILSHFNNLFKKVILSKSETTKKNSYHLIFPEFEGTIESQKITWAEWNEKYPDYVVDMNVYKTTYFRLPNQLKPYAGGSVDGLIPNTRHRIISGTINDFLLENYEEAITLNPPGKETRTRSRSSSEESNIVPSTDIAKYIDCLSEKRATEHESWIAVMFCLRNIESNVDENLDYWITFSKKCKFHDTESKLTLEYIKNKPKTIEQKAYRIGSLKKWAMDDNLELYKKYFPIKCLLDDEDESNYPFTEWEKTHCKILNPASYMEHKIDNDQETFILRNTKGLENAFNHLSIDLKTTNKKGEEVVKKGSFIKAWINLNDKIKIYDQIGMFPAPLKCPNNIYNCWSSFRGALLPSASEHPNELATFKKLLSVLCGHEQTSVDYFEKWIAQAIQYPAHKTTVPTIISKQGAGKGTLIKLLAAILGQNKVLSTTNADVVFGKFNNQMLEAYLVNLDELSPKDVKDVEHKVKGLITEPTISIDIKGVSSITIRSYHRFINTTNSEFGVFKTEAGDRRNFIVRASDELIGNKEFFTDFNENIINNNSVIKYIYDYLKSIPGLDKFHEAGNIPSTSYGEELKQASRNDYDLWLEDFTKRNKEGGNNIFTSKYLFEDFTKFVKKEGIFKSQSFGIRILNIVPNAISKGKHSRDGETKVFNWDILKKYYKTECLFDDEEDEKLSDASTTDVYTEVYIDGILQAD